MRRRRSLLHVVFYVPDHLGDAVPHAFVEVDNELALLPGVPVDVDDDRSFCASRHDVAVHLDDVLRLWAAQVREGGGPDALDLQNDPVREEEAVEAAGDVQRWVRHTQL